MISFYLSQSDDDNSYVMFGGYDKNDIDGEIKWHDVKKDYFWSVTLD